MGALRRVAVITGYEWRRALAQKKIIALIVLAVFFQTLTMVLLSQLETSPYLPAEAKPFMWIIGILQGQSFFVQLIAIITAGGSMSEEYEHGTADILLSKPVTRLEYMSGKFLGGFSLLVLVEGLTTFVGVVLAIGFFGSQTGVQYTPLMFLAIVYSTLIFFCLSFMFSEVFRKSTLAILVAFAILFTSQIISQLLVTFGMDTGGYFYLNRGLPTWSATYFPSFLISELITIPGTVFTPSDPSSLQQAAILIAVYAIIFVLIAAYRLLKSDVTKRI